MTEREVCTNGVVDGSFPLRIVLMLTCRYMHTLYDVPPPPSPCLLTLYPVPPLLPASTSQRK